MQILFAVLQISVKNLLGDRHLINGHIIINVNQLTGCPTICVTLHRPNVLWTNVFRPKEIEPFKISIYVNQKNHFTSQYLVDWQNIKITLESINCFPDCVSLCQMFLHQKMQTLFTILLILVKKHLVVKHLVNEQLEST